MTTTIRGRNVNYTYYEALWKMRSGGVQVETRNGRALRFPGPVITQYDSPTERMLLDYQRDANPFFHIFESIWMLAGRNDVKWLQQFNSNISTFSDDGVVFHGAYGFRWREHFGTDQLVWLVHHLKKDTASRRAVIQMFDPAVDQPSKFAQVVPKDIPCNTAIYFEIADGGLNMTVTNRSNDLVWGCYGANAVHMSILQEFVAGALGVPVGKYWQISNNLHVYERHFSFMDTPQAPHPYATEMERTHVALSTPATWFIDLAQFEEWVDQPDELEEGMNPYIDLVLNPMLRVWNKYKAKDKVGAVTMCGDIADLEVRIACLGWLARRKWETT